MTAKLTAEQRAALEPLTEKRQRFVLAYAGEALGNATEAARRAGYAKPGQEGCRLLKFAKVRAAVSAFQGPSLNRAVATIEQLQGRWTDLAFSNKVATKDSLKASELLARSLGAFVERQQVEHSGGTDVRIVATAEDVRRLASRNGKGGKHG